MAYAYMWEFRVKKEYTAQFEERYGPDGAWVRLFRQGNGYLQTELFHDVNIPGRFITVDYWTSKEAYENFRDEFHDDFTALDNDCEQLTESEQLIGAFSSVDERLS